MPGAISGVQGLTSGIKSADIIDALINAARGSTALVEKRQKVFQDRQTSLRALNTTLLNAQLDASALKSPTTFASRTASSSNTAVLNATASTTAIPGSYSVIVDRKAAAQQLATGGFASTTASLGTGTVNLQVGNGAVSTITLTSANSSLDGLAAAINAAGNGITASVVSDGSASPYRLILSGRDSGAGNNITVDASGLTGGTSAQLKKVVPGGSNTYAGAATLSGNYSGAAFAASVQVRVRAGTAADQNTTQFETSTDGSTWASVTNTGGTLALGSGLNLTLAAGTFAAADTFTVHPTQELVAAQDAQVRFGSSGSAITVTSKTNAITGLIPGVTLNLTGESPTAVTVTVGTDTTRAHDAITTFVKDFNASLKYLKDNGSFNSSTGKTGVLFSESDVQRGVQSVTSAFAAALSTLPQSMRDISSLGIIIDQSSGQLTIDDAKLNDKLAANPDAVGKLFINSGTSSNQGVSFITLTDKTKVTSPFTVDVTTVAAQAKVGASALAGSVVIDGTNRALAMTINGHAYALTLNTGTYTGTQLADHLQQVLTSAVSKGDEVSVSLDSGTGALDVHSKRYGSNLSIAVGAGAGATALGLASTTVTGVDVQGRINGGALLTGVGQVLNGEVGTVSEGLALSVSATSTFTGASITATKGLGQISYEKLVNLTNVKTGSFTLRDNGYQATIDGMTAQISKMDARLEQRKATLQAQFLAMETSIAKSQNTGNYLTGQIKGFENAAAAK